MTAQIKGDGTMGKTTAKRPYPGATLRHLGSVRDVTLATKTVSIGDGTGSPKHVHT